MQESSIRNCTREEINKFNCNSEKLNEFIYKYASQNDKKNFSKTFVLKTNDEIIGFYTLSCSCIIQEGLNIKINRSLPKYPIPSIKIARLAIDIKYQKQGYGKILLDYCFAKIIKTSVNIGVYCIEIDAKESATGFYEHYGFTCINEDKHIYVLPLLTLINNI